jgi:hypothetical protein
VNFGSRKADSTALPAIDSPICGPSEGYRRDALRQTATPGRWNGLSGNARRLPHVFLGLTAASLVTSFLGISTGAAGGLLLLALMASVLPPAVLLPIHTVVQLGSGITRTLMMWRHVMRGTLAALYHRRDHRAAAGAKIFVALADQHPAGHPWSLHHRGDLACRGLGESAASGHAFIVLGSAPPFSACS